MDCAYKGVCNATQIGQAQDYYGRMLTQLKPALVPPHGAFLTSCFQHADAVADFYWSDVPVQGTLMSEAFWRWYNGQSGTHVFLDQPWPSNPACKKIPAPL